MNLQQLLYGRRDPQEAIRRARAAVEVEFAAVDERAARMTMEETDRFYGVHGWNGRVLGESPKHRRHWFGR
jgi:hypothetical protein